LGTQDEDKQNKNTTQYVLYTTTSKPTQIKQDMAVTLDRPFLIATSVFSNVYFILLKYRYLNSSNELWFNTKPPVTLSS
jgi:hypothetical protein